MRNRERERESRRDGGKYRKTEVPRRGRKRQKRQGETGRDGESRGGTGRDRERREETVSANKGQKETVKDKWGRENQAVTSRGRLCFFFFFFHLSSFFHVPSTRSLSTPVYSCLSMSWIDIERQEELKRVRDGKSLEETGRAEKRQKGTRRPCFFLCLFILLFSFCLTVTPCHPVSLHISPCQREAGRDGESQG